MQIQVVQLQPTQVQYSASQLQRTTLKAALAAMHRDSSLSLQRAQNCCWQCQPQRCVLVFQQPQRPLQHQCL